MNEEKLAKALVNETEKSIGKFVGELFIFVIVFVVALFTLAWLYGLTGFEVGMSGIIVVWIISILIAGVVAGLIKGRK